MDNSANIDEEIRSISYGLFSDERKPVIFVGAGVSAESVDRFGQTMPMTAEFSRAIKEDLKRTDPSEYQSKNVQRLRALEQLASAYAECRGREELVALRRHVFDSVEWRPASSHLWTVRMFDDIMTTDYDTLLVDACKVEGLQHMVIEHDAQIKVADALRGRYDEKKQRCVLIYKAYPFDTLVDPWPMPSKKWLESNPSLCRRIRDLARGRVLLFVGYSKGTFEKLARFLGRKARDTATPSEWYFVGTGEMDSGTQARFCVRSVKLQAGEFFAKLKDFPASHDAYAGERSKRRASTLPRGPIFIGNLALDSFGRSGKNVSTWGSIEAEDHDPRGLFVRDAQVLNEYARWPEFEEVRDAFLLREFSLHASGGGGAWNGIQVAVLGLPRAGADRDAAETTKQVGITFNLTDYYSFLSAKEVLDEHYADDHAEAGFRKFKTAREKYLRALAVDRPVNWLAASFGLNFCAVSKDNYTILGPRGATHRNPGLFHISVDEGVNHLDIVLPDGTTIDERIRSHIKSTDRKARDEYVRTKIMGFRPDYHKGKPLDVFLNAGILSQEDAAPTTLKLDFYRATKRAFMEELGVDLNTVRHELVFLELGLDAYLYEYGMLGVVYLDLEIEKLLGRIRKARDKFELRAPQPVPLDLVPMVEFISKNGPWIPWAVKNIYLTLINASLRRRIKPSTVAITEMFENNALWEDIFPWKYRAFIAATARAETQ